MINPFIPVVNSYLPEPQASLLNGILFGVRSSMPGSFYNALIATGVLHIIALSGMNITILTNLTARMTLWLGRKASSIITMCLIVSFVLFVGASPTIVRAAMMGSLSLIAVYFGRQNWGLLSLILSGILMLLRNFSLIKDLSFQLSFLSTLGIILANKRVERQRKNGLFKQLIFFLKTNLLITLSAQIFTLPVILYRFHRISLISPLTNIMIEWVIQPVMVLGFITAIIGWVWWPLGILPAWFVWVPLTYLIKAVEILARVPGASISF
ncbi:hypothetical protein COY59_03880 [Candidatus Gottesmanbacteria bacterium CG_4_10_14_0_8_um_filter_37_24]|uniref:ComEC/Rec2-related protein domain-containing protein n=3 Tax=Candidatus Gottesmaniibacteriota TaxID=1752720 RepID=A0A2M7RRD4_9BACT|nr:MAG: hypothetical protein AUJ73_04700 [Candidatus Gottesmanbacteria bacterium CG1_02_37_22]PIP32110.1 MAG: hypothetical protein COX23_06475 [Candidatus Gottesmanbacteria bacterium CG23_combo_of_CG06-09_8_20_14_all_37_19]PIZ02609.1 MAG: hypothetical protein COY59_03880 [Candidatus Gottesmanbacteria bacterium CG_4_10_14_0_8_um_filter_37_24]